MTLGYTICFRAFGMRWAVFVGLTFDGGATTLVIGVTNQTGGTGALEGAARIATPGTWTAGSIFTEINDLAAQFGVASETGLTMTNLFVIFGRANSMFATRLANEAGNLTHVTITGLVAGTIIIRGTLDFAATRLRISKETFLTLTIGSMATGNALGIAATHCTTQANIFTTGSAIIVDNTHLIASAVLIFAAQHLLGANVVQTELEFGTGRVRFTGGLTNTLDT